MATVVALLDRPSPDSFGMVGIVIQTREGLLDTSGVLTPARRRLGSDQLAALISARHAVSVEPLRLEPEHEPLAALWVGDGFATRLANTRLRVPPLPEQSSRTTPTGSFWIAPPRHIYRVLDSFIGQAFRTVIKTEDAKLAGLMMWTMPERSESRAAHWLVSNERDRARDLQWWTRLAHDSGQSYTNPERIVADFRRLINVARGIERHRVVGFSAPAKGGDKEIARIVSKRVHLPMVSFGSWLLKRFGRVAQPPDRREMQRLGQHMIDTHGALSFSLDVLADISATKFENSFLVEGIRHIEVFESVRSLVGEDRFVLAYADRPLQLRRELLRTEGLSDAEIDDVLEDVTERDIPQLKEEAEYELDPSRADEEGERLIHELGLVEA